MKSRILSLLLAIVTSIVISACSDESIQPKGGAGGSDTGDRCQFGGCP